MTIQYIENTNLVYYNGYKFRKDKKSGYWLCSTLHKRLHCCVWEQYNGEIPKGYEVHHKDHNKDNNDISNLELMIRAEHRKLHSAELTDEQREWYRQNMIKNVIPAAAKIRKENYNYDYYAKIGKLGNDALQEKDFICECCNKPFKSKQTRSRFCSNACKSKWRRDNHLDDIEKICPVCGKTFTSNKYYKNSTCSKHCSDILYPRLPRLKNEISKNNTDKETS